jgi:uncharacterized protein
MKIDKVIVKIASRCNINCTYCFMYNMGDTSYKRLPKFISNETTDNFVEKILNHCKKNDIDTFWTIIHGGEPLLMNKKDFVEFIIAFDLLKENGITPLFSLQTNGILVDDVLCYKASREVKMVLRMSLPNEDLKLTNLTNHH